MLTLSKSSAALLLAAGLMLTGCGNSSNETSEVSAAPSAPAETATETVTAPPEDTESIPDDSDDDSAPGEEPGEGFPTNPVDYADALVVAWGEGDKPTMQDLAEPEAVQTLEEVSMPGGPHWQQAGSDAGAGSTFVTYENTDDGTRIDIRVGNEYASNGEPHAVAEVKLQE